VSATVEHIECLGHETLAHVSVDGGEAPVRLVARVPGMATFTKGDTVRLRAEPAEVYLFDREGRWMGD
jgi:ABC-type sugar transport system ATPase subunit